MIDRVRLHAVVRSDQTGKRRPDERLCQTAPRRQRARPSRVNTNTTLFKVLGLFDRSGTSTATFLQTQRGAGRCRRGLKPSLNTTAAFVLRLFCIYYIT